MGRACAPSRPLPARTPTEKTRRGFARAFASRARQHARALSLGRRAPREKPSRRTEIARVRVAVRLNRHLEIELLVPEIRERLPHVVRHARCACNRADEAEGHCGIGRGFEDDPRLVLAHGSWTVELTGEPIVGMQKFVDKL